VRNLAYDKTVFVRSTYNGWKNYLDWCAIYESSPADGYDLFRFEAALPGNAEKVEFCAGYIVYGIEYWDSNGGNNYGVQLQRRVGSWERDGGYMHVVQQAEALFNRFKSIVMVSSPPPEQELGSPTVSSLEVTVRIMQQNFEVESTEVTLAVDFAKECSADIARKVIGVLGDREGVSFESILVFDANIADYVQLEASNVLVKGGKYVVLLSFDPTALQDDSHLLTECVVCGDQLVRTQGIACQHDDIEALGVDYHMFCRDCTRKCKTAGCYYAVEIERHPNIEPAFRCPLCGANFCRLCQRDMHPLHEGVTCEELDRREEEARARDEMDSANRPVYDEMSAAVIRVCPRCSMHFVKSAGCNFMTCRCGMTMCYICKTTDINGNHFGTSCQQTEDAAVLAAAVLATLESKLRK
ncbi:Protein H18N23.2 a, partial [Aphelenchoides avenae]